MGNVIAEYEKNGTGEINWSKNYVYGGKDELVYMQLPQTTEMNNALENFVSFIDAWLCSPNCAQDDLQWDINSDNQIDLTDWAVAVDANDFERAFTPNGRYLLTDFHGSVVGEVDLDGNIDEISYDAWGEPIVAQGGDLEGLSILWNGYYHDSETGNYYLRNRYYSPQERRFITQDPRGVNPDGNWNNHFAVHTQYTDGYGLQVYAKSDPVNSRDDWGLYMDWFKSDWAGRAILWRWLTGGGDWDISDSKWAAYMKANDFLKTNIAAKLTYIASSLYRHKALRNEHKRIDMTFAAHVEDGESITGYNYLHGTNATVGDFKIIGFVGKKSKKCDCKIKFSLDYIWNDKIDSNKKYWTDRVKSAVAEYYFLGLPKDYRISIKWHTNPEYNVIERQKIKVVMKGWPFK